MSTITEQILVAALVLGAVLYLALRGRRKRQGCARSCGCGSTKSDTPRP
jgi:hypothetical protein